METEEIYKVITELVGPIHPVGSTHIDDQHNNNLAVMVELAEMILTDISSVAENLGRPEHSMHEAGKFANKFLQRVRNSFQE